MPNDTQAQVRCSSEEKSLWKKAAGGSRQFSSWARNLLNLAVKTKPKNEPSTSK